MIIEHCECRVHLRGLPSNVTKITLESGTLKNKRSRVVEDITNLLSNNWINGTVSHLAARDLEQLYEGNFLYTILFLIYRCIILYSVASSSSGFIM